MIQSETIGTTKCDFVEPKEFYEMASRWLSSDAFHHVVTLNPEMVMRAEHDTNFRNSINEAEIRVPDGAGLVWARWYLRSFHWPLFASLIAFSLHRTERVTGIDAISHISHIAQLQNAKVYLLGGTQTQVTKTADILRKKYPKLTVHTSADHAFDIEGPPAILQDIQEKEPQVLFVAYGAPKQTEWIEKHRQDLPSVRVALGVGGAFAIMSEETPRAPKMLRDLNIEWLWRLILEPSRLPRIWTAVIKFPQRIQQQKAALGKI